jgi:hypothetical protein
MHLLQMAYALNHIKMTPTYCSITNPSIPADIGTWNEKSTNFQLTRVGHNLKAYVA